MTSTETFHCTTCPSECLLTVCVERDGDGVARVTSVHGNRCPRGKRFAEQEVVCPMRILATTVVVEGGDERLVPVRMGDVIAANLLDTGVDLVASMDVGLA